MAFNVPYRRADAAAHARNMEATSRFSSIWTSATKILKLPQEVAVVNVRVLPPTWNAQDPYGPSLDPNGKIKSSQISTNPFFQIWQFKRVGPGFSDVLCTQLMLANFTGPGVETAHAKFAELGGKDMFYASYQEQRRHMQDRDLKAISPKSFWAAWCIDRRDPAESAMPKMLVITDDLYNKLQIAATLRDNSAAPFAAWTAEGSDLQIKMVAKSLPPRDGGAPTKIHFPDAITLSPDREGSPAVLHPSMEERVGLYIYENPVPKMLKFLSAERMAEMLGTTVNQSAAPSDASKATSSWGAKRPSGPIISTDDESSVPDPEDFRPAAVKPSASMVDDDEDEAPVAPPKKPAQVGKVRVPAPQDSDFEDEVPAPKKPAAKPAAKPVEDFDDEDEAPAPAPAPKKPAAKPASKPVEDFDDEDEAPAPAPKKAAPPATKKAPAAKRRDAYSDDDE